MAQHLSPPEPGADWLDEGINRLRAMKSTVGLVFARALEAAHSRFLVLGSTLAHIEARTTELERRDSIHWPTLKDELEAMSRRLIALESGQIASAEWRANVLQRLEQAENTLADELIRLGLGARGEQANATATRALLRAALAVLDPPLSARDLLTTRKTGT